MDIVRASSILAALKISFFGPQNFFSSALGPVHISIMVSYYEVTILFSSLQYIVANKFALSIYYSVCLSIINGA